MPWNSCNYKHHACFVSEMGTPLLELLNPQQGEAILDLGCGDGTLALQIMELGAKVQGIDSSPDMISTACKSGVSAQVMDGESLNFNQCFDAVFSNAALHWMKNPTKVLSGVFHALKPKGRFCAEFGAEGNIQTVIDALHLALQNRNLCYDDYNPWYFPNPSDYKRQLLHAGFKVHKINSFRRPTPLPTNIQGWLDVFAFPFLTAVTDKKDFTNEVITYLKNHLEKIQEQWHLDYVRCRLLACKPSS